MNLLRIDSSTREKSVSRQLADAFVAAWIKQCLDGEIVTRDLTSSVIPAISDEWVAAARTDPTKRGPVDQQVLALSDEFVDELNAADIILIGSPLYNFTISAPLKAWIDHVIRPGRTVEYGPQGPKGLLGGRKVVVLTSRGGTYSDGGPRSGLDYQEPYLRVILAFMGLADVTFIHAENQLRRDQADQCREAAVKKINELVSHTPWPSTGKSPAVRTSSFD